MTGCTPDRPIMCGDGQCYPNYSYCKPLAGCTDPMNPVMCPAGTCVSDFDHCLDKVYDCPLDNNVRCGDGVCRESCDGIATNGCPSETPVYCQNGDCVQFMNQCFDFRCSLDNPILCSNLQCRESLTSCPKNSLSTMIADTEEDFFAREGSSIMEQIEVTEFEDNNETKLTLKAERRNLYFPVYTAAYQINDEKGIDSAELRINVSAIPISDLRETHLRYLNLNIDAEAFTNKIFTRGLSSIRPHQFMRSFVFDLSLGEDGYNHVLFNRPMEGLFKFNIINGYPNTGLTTSGTEDDEDEYTGEEQEVDKIDLLYPPDEPENVYCLGLLNPVLNRWRCVNRIIKEITEESIMYDIPGPGIYAVLFFPKLGDEQEALCGWLCRNKKAVTTFLIFYLPLFILFGTYLWMVTSKMYKDAKDTLKKFKDQMQANVELLKEKADKMKNQNEDVENTDQPVQKESVIDNNKMNQMRYMEKLKQDKADVEKLRDIMNEANYEVKGQTLTFINPLVFNKKASTEVGAEIQEMENKKIEMKFKREGLLAKKMKKLGKITLLKEEILNLQTDIEHLKKIQGDNFLLEMERQEEEGPLDDQYKTFKEEQPKVRPVTNDRNLEGDDSDSVGDVNYDSERS